MSIAAFVTLVATDSYAPGALVLAYSLKDVRTRHQTVCLVTPEVSSQERSNLITAFDRVVDVPRLESNDESNLNVLGRPELGLTFTKLHAWSLVQYSRACFLDADTLVLRNVDELLDENGPYLPFAAAPDSGWPDCFNSGVFVYTPSLKTMDELKRMAAEGGSFDGADQGLLNKYYSNWSREGREHRLPFIYNVTPSAVYSYAPAYKAMHADIAIMHFIGTLKPWHWERTSDGGVMPKGLEHADIQKHVQRWWSIHDNYVSKWNKSKGSFSKQVALEQGYANTPSQPMNPHAQTDHAAPYFEPMTSSLTDFASYRVDWNMRELSSRPRSSSSSSIPENPFATSSKHPMHGGEHEPVRADQDEEDDRVPIRTKRRSAADLIPGPPGVSKTSIVKAPTSGGAASLPPSSASKINSVKAPTSGGAACQPLSSATNKKGNLSK